MKTIDIMIKVLFVKSGLKSGSLVRIVKKLVKNAVILGMSLLCYCVPLSPYFSLQRGLFVWYEIYYEITCEIRVFIDRPAMGRKEEDFELKYLMRFSPCERCVKYGLNDCVDSTRKPRKTGIKR